MGIKLKQHAWFLLILVVLLSNCSRKPISTPVSDIKINAINCTLSPINFAESITGNDEILLLVYENTAHPQLVHQLYWEDNKAQSFLLELEDLEEPVLSFVLIEMDTEKAISEIETLVNNNLSIAKYAPHASNSTEIQDLLDDDDLLGIESLNLTELKPTTTLDITGIHLFDSYHYRLEVGME